MIKIVNFVMLVKEMLAIPFHNGRPGPVKSISSTFDKIRSCKKYISTWLVSTGFLFKHFPA